MDLPWQVHKNVQCTEHFIFADDKILTMLSTLFTSFLIHGHMPSEFMKSAISPKIIFYEHQ